MADIIVGAFQQALNLIASGDPEVYATIYRTIYVAGLGTLMSCLWSIPLAVVIRSVQFQRKMDHQRHLQCINRHTDCGSWAASVLALVAAGRIRFSKPYVHTQRHSNRASHTSNTDNS